MKALTEAAQDIGEVSEQEILRVAEGYRKQKRAPEITVASENEEEKARGSWTPTCSQRVSRVLIPAISRKTA